MLLKIRVRRPIKIRERRISRALRIRIKPNPDSRSASQEQHSMQAFSKYDFVPGERVIFFDDFSQDAVGDFPALWTANAAGEINTLNIAPGNWLNLNSTDGNYFYLKKVDFPKNFIIEFDIVPKKE